MKNFLIAVFLAIFLIIISFVVSDFTDRLNNQWKNRHFYGTGAYVPSNTNMLPLPWFERGGDLGTPRPDLLLIDLLFWTAIFFVIIKQKKTITIFCLVSVAVLFLVLWAGPILKYLYY